MPSGHEQKKATLFCLLSLKGNPYPKKKRNRGTTGQQSPSNQPQGVASVLESRQRRASNHQHEGRLHRLPKSAPCWGLPKMLWMDKILHQFETMKKHCLLAFTGKPSFQGFLGGAGFRPSTVGLLQKDGVKQNPKANQPSLESSCEKHFNGSQRLLKKIRHRRNRCMLVLPFNTIHKRKVQYFETPVCHVAKTAGVSLVCEKGVQSPNHCQEGKRGYHLTGAVGGPALGYFHLRKG